ncbi:MAG: fibronectin type III domain-containing protein [Ornithinimicrobium sp.]
MSDPVVSIEPSSLTVEPGGQVRLEVKISNQSTIVDGYRITVFDDRELRGAESGPADWVEVLPPDGAADQDGAHVSVYPQQQQSVVLIFSPPPGGETLGGSWAFAVRVASVVDEDSSIVLEGDLELGRVLSTQGKLTPVTSSGRWRGLHVVQLTNWGNTARRLRLRGEDPDEALAYFIHPEVVEVAVGGTATARVKVRTRAPRLRGAVARLPFTVVGTEDSGQAETSSDETQDAPAAPPPPAQPRMPRMPPSLSPTGDGERVVIDGAFTQRPILTRAFVTGLVLLLAGLIALIAFALSRREEVVTYESLGVPPTPVLTAETTGSDTILLSWAPVSRVEGYVLERLQPNSDTTISTQDLDPELGAHPVDDLDSDTEACFTLTAIRGDEKSPPSERACSRTEPAEDDGSATTASPSEEGSDPDPDPEETNGGGTETPTVPPDDAGETAEGPTPPEPPTTEPPSGEESGDNDLAAGEWVALLRTYPAGSIGQPGAERDVAILQEEGIPAELLFSDDFPTMTPPLQATWIVYLDEDYAGRESAMQGCREARAASDTVTFCNPPIQPKPIAP